MLQLLLCRRGEDVILVSFNHLDTIRELVGDSESHVAMVDYACKVMADVSSILLLPELQN